MSSLIDIQEPGDIVWTMDNGKLRSWEVQDDGTLIELDPVEAIRR